MARSNSQLAHPRNPLNGFIAPRYRGWRAFPAHCRKLEPPNPKMGLERRSPSPRLRGPKPIRSSSVELLRRAKARPSPPRRGGSAHSSRNFHAFGVDLLPVDSRRLLQFRVQCAKFSLAANLHAEPDAVSACSSVERADATLRFSALPKPVNRCNRWRRVASCRRLTKATTQRNSMRPFETLTEREILALAIALEEEDARIYDDFADGLKEDYPEQAKKFNELRS